jgi:hypothetical protein
LRGLEFKTLLLVQSMVSMKMAWVVQIIVPRENANNLIFNAKKEMIIIFWGGPDF